MNHFRKRLSYANVTATLALVIALAGGAYAAVLARDSVKSKHIASNAAKGRDVEESTLGAVPTAKGLKHPDFGRISTSQLVDLIGIGMVMGRVNGAGNLATLYTNPSGEDAPSTIESEHLMGLYLSGSEAQDLQVELPTGTMPASTSRTFTLRAGNDEASMADTSLSCTIDAGESSCGDEDVVALSQLQDTLSIKIVTTGSPGSQNFVFGYAFTSGPGT
jgi:hypothetical protein